MNQNSPLLLRILRLATCLVFATRLCCSASCDERPNVLFIAVDDLRPELTSFGAENMVTPNLDRLAKRGMRFDRAYCMVPTCGASRASLMTGIRPAKDRFVTFTARADQDTPGVTTLNTHFKNHGYTTLSLGKVFHNPADNVDGWSQPPAKPRAPTYATEASSSAMKKDAKGRKRGPSWENGGDVTDDTYTDGVIANEAISQLRELASEPGKPFFFAVGFTKPHLPFVAPGAYFEKYPASEVRMPCNYFPPKDAPAGAVHNSGELRSYSDIPSKGVLSEAKARELIRAYHAATSYTDAHIGRLLDVFDELKLADNTIIVLWGDHGWNLGEHTMWCKHSCFETSLRAPLIFATPPRMKTRSGEATSSLVEFIDIYPTLCELTGLPLPGHLDGQSLTSILKDPTATIKDSAISRFKDGDTIRTDRYRYTLYQDKKGNISGHMLFDHQNDPGENVNLADDPSYADAITDLRVRLQSQMGKPRELRVSTNKKSAAQKPTNETSLLRRLAITETQKPKFLLMQKSMNDKRAESQQMSAEERRSKQQEFYRARKRELARLLTPEKMTKLRELRTQRPHQQSSDVDTVN
ncbi:MAG: sulfatase [Planctomycetota bacterium]